MKCKSSETHKSGQNSRLFEALCSAFLSKVVILERFVMEI